MNRLRKNFFFDYTFCQKEGGLTVRFLVKKN
jgi:hypothetical protein